MAYRRAWLLTDEVNHMFVEPLVLTRGGGRNGGGATLTPLGERVVALYRALESKVRDNASDEIAALEQSLAAPSAA